MQQLTILLFFMAAGRAALATAAVFQWNCQRSLAACNNACFAISHGLASAVLNYDANKSTHRPCRTASGCNRSPCSSSSYSKWGDSCDEFPFASTAQGGKGMGSQL